MLVENPHQTSTVVDYDQVDRPLNLVLLRGWLITYWVDHGEQEVRVVDVVQP